MYEVNLSDSPLGHDQEREKATFTIIDTLKFSKYELESEFRKLDSYMKLGDESSRAHFQFNYPKKTYKKTYTSDHIQHANHPIYSQTSEPFIRYIDAINGVNFRELNGVEDLFKKIGINSVRKYNCLMTSRENNSNNKGPGFSADKLIESNCAHVMEIILRDLFSKTTPEQQQHPLFQELVIATIKDFYLRSYYMDRNLIVLYGIKRLCKEKWDRLALISTLKDPTEQYSDLEIMHWELERLIIEHHIWKVKTQLHCGGNSKKYFLALKNRHPLPFITSNGSVLFTLTTEQVPTFQLSDGKRKGIIDTKLPTGGGKSFVADAIAQIMVAQEGQEIRLPHNGNIKIGYRLSKNHFDRFLPITVSARGRNSVIGIGSRSRSKSRSAKSGTVKKFSSTTKLPIVKEKKSRVVFLSMKDFDEKTSKEVITLIDEKTQINPGEQLLIVVDEYYQIPYYQQRLIREHLISQTEELSKKDCLVLIFSATPNIITKREEASFQLFMADKGHLTLSVQEKEHWEKERQIADKSQQEAQQFVKAALEDKNLNFEDLEENEIDNLPETIFKDAQRILQNCQNNKGDTNNRKIQFIFPDTSPETLEQTFNIIERNPNFRKAFYDLGFRGFITENKTGKKIYSLLTDSGSGMSSVITIRKDIGEKEFDSIISKTDGHIGMFYGSNIAIGGDYNKYSQNVDAQVWYMGTTLDISCARQYAARNRKPNMSQFNHPENPVQCHTIIRTLGETKTDKRIIFDMMGYNQNKRDNLDALDYATYQLMIQINKIRNRLNLPSITKEVREEIMKIIRDSLTADNAIKDILKFINNNNPRKKIFDKEIKLLRTRISIYSRILSNCLYVIDNKTTEGGTRINEYITEFEELGRRTTKLLCQLRTSGIEFKDSIGKMSFRQVFEEFTIDNQYKFMCKLVEQAKAGSISDIIKARQRILSQFEEVALDYKRIMSALKQELKNPANSEKNRPIAHKLALHILNIEGIKVMNAKKREEAIETQRKIKVQLQLQERQKEKQDEKLKISNSRPPSRTSNSRSPILAKRRNISQNAKILLYDEKAKNADEIRANSQQAHEIIQKQKKETLAKNKQQASIIREKEQAERKAREEAERKAREEAERKAREEAEREQARREQEQKEIKKMLAEEAERRAKKEAEKFIKKEEIIKPIPISVPEPEQKNIVKEEVVRKAKEEAERKVLEFIKKAKEEREEELKRIIVKGKVKEEAEKLENKIKEEAERKAREEAEREQARREQEQKEIKKMLAEEAERLEPKLEPEPEQKSKLELKELEIKSEEFSIQKQEIIQKDSSKFNRITLNSTKIETLFQFINLLLEQRQKLKTTQKINITIKDRENIIHRQIKFKDKGITTISNVKVLNYDGMPLMVSGGVTKDKIFVYTQGKEYDKQNIENLKDCMLKPNNKLRPEHIESGHFGYERVILENRKIEQYASFDFKNTDDIESAGWYFDIGAKTSKGEPILANYKFKSNGNMKFIGFFKNVNHSCNGQNPIDIRLTSDELNIYKNNIKRELDRRTLYVSCKDENGKIHNREVKEEEFGLQSILNPNPIYEMHQYI